MFADINQLIRVILHECFSTTIYLSYTAPSLSLTLFNLLSPFALSSSLHSPLYPSPFSSLSFLSCLFPFLNSPVSQQTHLSILPLSFCLSPFSLPLSPSLYLSPAIPPLSHSLHSPCMSLVPVAATELPALAQGVPRDQCQPAPLLCPGPAAEPLPRGVGPPRPQR